MQLEDGSYVDQELVSIRETDHITWSLKVPQKMGASIISLFRIISLVTRFLEYILEFGSRYIHQPVSTSHVSSGVNSPWPGASHPRPGTFGWIRVK